MVENSLKSTDFWRAHSHECRQILSEIGWAQHSREKAPQFTTGLAIVIAVHQQGEACRRIVQQLSQDRPAAAPTAKQNHTSVIPEEGRSAAVWMRHEIYTLLLDLAIFAATSRNFPENKIARLEPVGNQNRRHFCHLFANSDGISLLAYVHLGYTASS